MVEDHGVEEFSELSHETPQVSEAGQIPIEPPEKDVDAFDWVTHTQGYRDMLKRLKNR